MLSIILLMLAGIAIGFFFISRDATGKILKICGRIQQIATILLLFVIGLWLGGNNEFWDKIQITGLHGFLFALVTIAGSIIAVFFFSNLLIRGDKS